MDGIELFDLRCEPKTLPKSTVLRPIERPIRRNLGANHCTIHMQFQDISIAYQLITTFLGFESDNENTATSDSTTAMDDDSDGYTCSITSRLENLLFSFCDPILKNHLPIAIVSIPSLTVNIFQPTNLDLYTIVALHVFVDYFNLTRKSWEPLIDPPLKCNVMYESSSDRGKGVTYVSNTICNINLTSALIELIDEIQESFISSFQTSFFGSKTTASAAAVGFKNERPSLILRNTTSNDSHYQMHDSARSQIHSTARMEKVPFSIYNFTGNNINVHQKYNRDHRSNDSDLLQSPLKSPPSNTQIGSDRIITLKNNDRSKLKFPATISVIRNAQVIEIPLSTYFHGDYRRIESSSASISNNSNNEDWQSTNLAVDVHIPC